MAKVSFSIFRPYRRTTEVHQKKKRNWEHQQNASILGPIKLHKLFDKYLQLWKTQRPKTWKSVFFIYLLKHNNFLTLSIEQFYRLVARQWRRSIDRWNMAQPSPGVLTVDDAFRWMKKLSRGHVRVKKLHYPLNCDRSRG